MPNLLLGRAEIEGLIVDFDIGQSISEEEGDLPEICIQQGIDASAKKKGGRAKGSKKAKKPPKPKKNKAKNKTSAPKQKKNTAKPKTPTMSRGEQLRKKHGSSMQGYESRVRKFTGKDGKKHIDAVRRGARQLGVDRTHDSSATAKSIARHQRKQAKKAPTVSRGEQLRKKHGSAAAGYAAYRDKNVGSNKFRAGAKGFARTQSGKKSTGGVISRPQFMSGAIEKSINRKARKTGKSITAIRKVNLSHEGDKPDIHTQKFKGDTTRGGSRKPVKTKHSVKPFRRKKA